MRSTKADERNETSLLPRENVAHEGNDKQTLERRFRETQSHPVTVASFPADEARQMGSLSSFFPVRQSSSTALSVSALYVLYST